MLTTKKNSNNVFVVGPMGVGKTTIGRILSKELGLKFIDVDEEIERRAGANISWIFDVEGEGRFRDRETQVLEDLTSMKNVLLSTGGGAVLRKENRKWLETRGLVIYLIADADILVKRTKNDNKRPLLRGKNVKKMIETILRERGYLYEQVSDIVIPVEDRSSRQTVSRIMDVLNREGYIG